METRIKREARALRDGYYLVAWGVNRALAVHPQSGWAYSTDRGFLGLGEREVHALAQAPTYRTHR